MKKFLSRFLSIASLISMTAAAPAQAQIVRPGATTLIFYNATNTDVPVMVTAPQPVQTDGCPSGTTAMLRTLDITAGGALTPLTQFNQPYQGWFILKAGRKVQLINMGLNPYTRQVSSCFQTMHCGFGQIGNSCPDFSGAGTSFPITTPGPKFNTGQVIPLPNGSNAFEFTLNLPGTQNGVASSGLPTQEGMNISCVNGVNCKIMVTVTPPVGGPYWTTLVSSARGGLLTFRSVSTMGPNSFLNVAQKIDDNCVDPATGYARMGVFPYGATVCNGYPDKVPPCTANGMAFAQFCAAKNGLPFDLSNPANEVGNGCIWARSPLVAGKQIFGGTVMVTYMGPLNP